MDNEHTPTAEELAAEQAALQPSKEEEVKAKVMEEFGFDESTDPALVEKAVKKEMSHRDALSKTIAQKIKHRTAADELRSKVTSPAPAPKPTETPTFKPEDIDARVEEKLQQRDLDAIQASDDLKKEIKRVAQIRNISIAEAARDPYIVAKLDVEQKDADAKDATISRKNRSSGSKKFDINNPPDCDMSTLEGRKEWEAWTAEAKKQGN